jgi:hypothetical protein
MIKKTSKRINQCTVLIEGTRTIFTDQLPTYLVLRKVNSFLASEFSAVYHVFSQIVRMERHNLK